MSQPLDAITAFHNAFRRDISEIDAAALESARGNNEFTSKIERFRFLNEVLVWHAQGEEIAIFPVMETVAPSVADAYERDHRGLDAAFEVLSHSVSSHDKLATARATAAFKFFLDMHLDKEDAHLYRIFRERVPLPDQGKAVGIMASAVPQDRFPEVVTWLLPLIGLDDRENMTRIWQMVLPPPAFSSVKELIKKAIGNEWDELVKRIPTLA